jgi:leader peptidase (prepilin peptidase)/N-methyltransferase
MQNLTALAAVFLAGVTAGAAVNWAVYWLAWNRRAISPWSPADPQAPPRRASDRLPVWGWLGLRREQPLHGRGFWLRPLAVELLMGVGWAALWWWEVDRQGLLAKQFVALVGAPLAAPAWITHATFASHALLVALMAAASLIDIDEKTIPGAITTPGTLVGLALATIAPMSLLPTAAMRILSPLVGEALVLPKAVETDGAALYVEPTHPAAPDEWLAVWDGAPQWRSLAIGLACYLIWCFALAPRRLHTRHGLVFGMRVVLARVAREFARPPLLWLALGGAAAIVGVWYLGGPSWVGLFTALVGMIGGSAIVWGVRLAGTHALRREALGFGDVTLMMMVGAFLGWQAGVIIFFAAPFAGLVVAILQLVLRRSDEIFFGPFLCLAAAAVMVRWADLWNVQSALQQVFGEAWLVTAILAGGVAVMWAMLVLWRNAKEAALGVRTPSRDS